MDVPYDEDRPAQAEGRPLLGRMLLAHCGGDEREAARRRKEIERRAARERLETAARVHAQEDGGLDAGKLAGMLLAWREQVREEARREMAQLREGVLEEVSRLLVRFTQGGRRG